ncbi:hypothetical protein K2Z84_19750 [Candidatus Binatia bacterium]|nr:hypothetical protein [Candidatus Binatia bacterium]
MLHAKTALVALGLALFASSAALLTTPRAEAATCDAAGADAGAIAAARAAIDAQCNCAGAARHGDYVKCARGILAGLVGAGQLPGSCKGAAQRCASRSTCGRAGAVTCCRTTSAGVTSGSIKSSAAACRAPRGGTACVADHASLCDACDGAGCAPSCGNGVVEAGEQCEPPGTATCDASCQTIAPVCGNDTVEAGEECEPPGTATCDASCQRVPLCGDGFVDGGEACDGTPSAGQCGGQAICGAPGDAMACQCCSSGPSVLFDIYAAPYDPAPCCADGSDCAVTAPHFCSCEGTP